MDDSGSHADSLVCLLAGYWGHVNQWRKFEKRWKAILARYEVQEFHAQRFWARGPKGVRFDEYKHWPAAKARRFMDSLLAIIETTLVHPFACGVMTSEWKKKTVDERRIFTGATKQYPTGAPKKSIFLAFQLCVSRVSSYCAHYFPDMKVHFFMDDNPQTSGWASICFSQLKSVQLADAPISIVTRMGDLTLADSRVATPLQAADLLAYEANLYCRAAVQDPKAKMRQVYRRALAKALSKDDFWLFDERRFESFDRFLRSSFPKHGPVDLGS